jgi:mono/diheme cytochrome c family protein
MNLRGSPPAFPSLVGVTQRLSDNSIIAMLRQGKGRMPSFPAIDGPRQTALLKFLKNPENGRADASGAAVASLAVGPDRRETAGMRVYNRDCALCHGDDLLGAPSNYPSLIGVRGWLGDKLIVEFVRDGKGRMPGFPHMSDTDAAALLRFLGPMPTADAETPARGTAKQGPGSEVAPPDAAAKYRFTGYLKFLDPDGYPAVQPP